MPNNAPFCREQMCGWRPGGDAAVVAGAVAVGRFGGNR